MAQENTWKLFFLFFILTCQEVADHFFLLHCNTLIEGKIANITKTLLIGVDFPLRIRKSLDSCCHLPSKYLRYFH